MQSPYRLLMAKRWWILPLLIQALPTHAQTRPDAGSVLQETRPAPDSAPPVTTPPIQAPASPRPAVPAGAGDARVNVTNFVFTGNTELSQEVLEAAVAEWSGKPLTFGELIQAVEKIEATYKAAGYFLAQAILPPQKIRDGAIEIAIAEGRLGETRLEGESRIHPDVLYQFLDRLPKGKALTLPTLERQVLLINELAGGKAALDMQAGEANGTTDIVLAQKPDEAVNGRVEVNNHGSPSTGDKRLSVNLIANSPLNLGDRLTASFLTTDINKLRSYNLRHELPVGGDGWRINTTASRAEYSLAGIAASSGFSGVADSIRVGAAYPVIRSRTANLRLQADGFRSKLVDRCNSAPTAYKTSHGISAGVASDWMDDTLGGGANKIDMTLVAGDVSDSKSVAADCTPRNSGSFQKLTIAVSRQQTITQEIGLQLQLSHQLSNKNLDSSEKLSVGGPTSLPGYGNGDKSGDEGTQAKLALRWQATNEIALTLFTDYARLKVARNPLTADSNTPRLTDAGISIDWMVGKGVTASAIIAWAGKENPVATENDKPRMWFTLGYGW